MKFYSSRILFPFLHFFFFLGISCGDLHAQIQINEFLASNDATLLDEDGDDSDWIELLNTSQTGINLAGWTLSDDSDTPKKWTFPAREIPPGSYLVVFASGKDRTNGPQLHANFNLASEGGDLILANPAGTLISQFVSYPPQRRNISYGFHKGPDGLTPSYFKVMTPGQANGAPYLGLLLPPRVNYPAGIYHTNLSLLLSPQITGEEIRYTTNGTLPSLTNGFRFVRPLFINRTTLIRAASFQDSYLPSEVLTLSYLLTDSTAQQANSLPGYPTVWEGGHTADYGMDPNLLQTPAQKTALKNSLLALPTLSLVAPHFDLWNQQTGLYPNATSEGPSWERAASIEIISTNGKPFQVDCGIQMQGNASRYNDRTPKHSIRLLFKSKYGPEELHYPWFEHSNVDHSQTVILRACFTDSWPSRIASPRYHPENALYLRDVWMKDSQRDMGWLSGDQSFVHLYINGLYWGVYGPAQRLDAHFFASHLGGEPEEWDVLRDFSEVLDGNKQAWSQMMSNCNSGVATEAQYQTIARDVDIENLIDYMILHILGEAEDWPHHNWYAARRRASENYPGGKWIFLTWDQEIVLNPAVPRNRIDVNNDDTPARIYFQLRNYPEFQRIFGDRLHRHLFNDGQLTPTRNITRLRRRADQIREAMVAESVRWGDARRNTTGKTFTRDEFWVPELERLCTSHFNKINSLTIERFRAGTLYPQANGVELSQFGGSVPKNYGLELTHSNAQGLIFFTLDGTDPRVYGTGLISTTAQNYSTPVQITESTPFKARVLSGVGGWSALSEATFYVAQDWKGLKFTEVMYHPVAPETNGIGEFIELKNEGAHALDLGGLLLRGDADAEIPFGTTLQPQEFLMLVEDASRFGAAHPQLLKLQVRGKLSNGGGRIQIRHPLQGPLIEINYSDDGQWPRAADGLGFSLVPVQSQTNFNKAQSWRISAAVGGSPGKDDPERHDPAVLINEILSASDAPDVDKIELVNRESTEADLSGWYLSDELSDPKKYRLATGTKIPGGAFHVFSEEQFGKDFSLSASGEEVFLIGALPNGDLNGYISSVAFRSADGGRTFGRFAISSGAEHFIPQRRATFGGPNSGPLVGPLVFSEICAVPPDGKPGFVEIQNISNTSVVLSDPVGKKRPWKLDGLGCDFPLDFIIPPSGILVITEVDPEVFRRAWKLGFATKILGYTSGELDREGETLKIKRPDNKGTTSISIEEVDFDRNTSWPLEAFAGDKSLQKSNLRNFSNDPAGWMALSPTPGESPLFDRDGDGLPDDWEILFGTQVDVADHTADPDMDGITNFDEYVNATNPVDVAPKEIHLFIRFPGPEIGFSAEEGIMYRIETTDDLGKREWSLGGTVGPVDSDREIWWLDGNAPQGRKFYRVTVGEAF